VSRATWDTRETPPAGFENAWNARLASSGQSGFRLELPCIRWEAAHGRNAIAVLVEGDGRRAALLLRDTRQGFSCGTSSRWDLAFEPAAPDGPLLGPEDGRWLLEQAQAIAGRRRLLLHLPVAAPGGVPGFSVGHTLVTDLRGGDDALERGLPPRRRRQLEKARAAGMTIVTASGAAQYRAFARLLAARSSRRGAVAGLPDSPPPGESWREWELDWMWLLVAERDGVVEAGAGFACGRDGVIVHRASAASPEGRKSGALALLAWEAMVRGRAGGARALNWGGATGFKRAMGGTPVEMHLWLGGGARWTVPNHVAATARSLRARVEKLARRDPPAGSPDPA
jgi:hypothetical protein